MKPMFKWKSPNQRSQSKPEVQQTSTTKKVCFNMNMCPPEPELNLTFWGWRYMGIRSWKWKPMWSRNERIILYYVIFQVIQQDPGPRGSKVPSITCTNSSSRYWQRQDYELGCTAWRWKQRSRWHSNVLEISLYYLTAIQCVRIQFHQNRIAEMPQKKGWSIPGQVSS